MLSYLKRLLSIETKSQGLEIDFENAWTIDKVDDKKKLLARVIDLVPLNSIWAIEGLYDQAIIDVLQPFLITDEIKIQKATVWPKQDSYKVALTSAAMQSIIQAIKGWNLDNDIEHQLIYFKDAVLFRSYDFLLGGCIYFSNSISKAEIQDLLDQGIVSIDDE